MDFFYLRSGPPEVWRIIRHAFGQPNSDVRDFVPEYDLKRMYWSSRFYVAIIAGFAAWSVAINSFLPMMFVALPRFYGGWLHQLLGLTQHAGLGEDTLDHRENTRTVYINPVFSYLYMNMNYHIEHHSTPMVPYHALPQYHEAIKDQTPTPYSSLWQVYKEMVPALIKQATEDPDYHIKRVMPSPTTAAVTKKTTDDEAMTAKTLPVTVRDWVEVCAADDLDEEDVVGLEYKGKTYAVYRLVGNDYYATDGLCTHERESLAGGLVIDGCIECPKHNGRFDIVTGKAVRRPVREDINTYPAERRGDQIYICIPG
jgi:MocE subfamily Rieske [2Fe-2S] domain protein